MTTTKTEPAESRSANAPIATQQADPAPPRILRKMLALDDFEDAARRHIPRPIFGYASGGAETNASMRANRAVWDELAFVPKALVDTSGRAQKTTLFGHIYDAPFGIAPMGGTAMAAYQGDLVLARAAAAANIPMVLSGASLTPLEQVRQEGPTAWFQAYLPGENDTITRARRARGARRLRHAGSHRRRAGGGQPREQRAQRFPYAAAAVAAPGVGRPHPSALAVRHVFPHAAAAWHAALREHGPAGPAPFPHRRARQRTARSACVAPRRTDAAAVEGTPDPEREYSTRKTRASPATAASTASSCRITAGASSTARSRRCACCPGSWPRPAE